MSKTFKEAFEEWKQDNRYAIEDDCGWEFSDVPEPAEFEEDPKG